MWSSRIYEGFFNYQDAGLDSTFASVDTASMSSATGIASDMSPSASIQNGPSSSTSVMESSTSTMNSFGSSINDMAGLGPSPSGLAGLGPSPSGLAGLGPSTSGLAGLGPSPSGLAGLGPSPSGLAGLGPSTTSTGVSVTYLQDLMYRIDQESIALSQLPESPTTIAKVNQLSSMRDQINTYVQKLLTNPPQLTIEEVPITKEAADSFLRSLGTPTATGSEYPSLFTSPSQAPTTAAPGAAPGAATSLGALGSFDFGSMEQAQGMFQTLQDVKWRIELSYDPSLSQKTDLLNRLEALEKRIMAYAKEGVAMPDSVKQVLSRELDLLTTVIKNTKQSETSTFYKPRQSSQHTRMTSSSSATSYRSADGRTYSNPVQDSEGGYSLFDGVPRDSADVRIRPGFVLTDEQIRRRGSAAAFNTQAVGGADYKKRAEEVCRQIRGANIGTPGDFGCIENPSEVSASYSWKGNYEMICSRLGDTWGSWYPAMFGCPSVTPDDRYNGKLL